MSTAPPAPDRSDRPALGAGGAFLVASCLLAAFTVVRHLGVFDDDGIVGAFVLVALLAVVVRLAGLSAADLGLARSDAGRGIAHGAVALAAVTAVVAAAAAVPATAGFFEDDRVNVTAAGMVYEVVVPILLITVIPEELAFRGVLLATASSRWGHLRGTVAASGLFGLWHISPTLSTMTENASVRDATGSVGGEIAVVAGAVALTFLAGLGFSWLRVRSRSILTPVLAHLATNGATFVVAWSLVR